MRQKLFTGEQLMLDEYDLNNPISDTIFEKYYLEMIVKFSYNKL